MSAPIRKVLIANRGEIACRIMRTAKAKGIATVAVYSDADADAVHVKQADEAVHIGASPASDSYLRIDAIIDAARKTGADAIHPGYGFLSENAGFAAACAAANITFIGPPASAIAAMGDKAKAKAIMEKAGVPTVPGYRESQNDEALAAAAKEIGTPLLIKAVAGGGGRGMRRVDDLADFAEALQSARREAQNAFGNGDVMLEKLITGGRHIEFQIFADDNGAIIHLGERDCSAQRRHQKIIEEAPAPGMSPELRQRMGADAVTAARAVDYRNAGTVEFLLAEDGAHYFLEMNTRLQVEHPVTEMVTGLDLVDWQLRVAAGEALPLAQDEVTLSGHSIEARLYAEDPAAGFAPQAGPVLHWAGTSPGIRIDSGIVEGGVISPYYDPMVAKIIAHGGTRAVATAKLRAALTGLPLLGVATNRTLLLDLLDSAAFAGGTMDTGTIDRWIADGDRRFEARPAEPLDLAIAATMLALENGGDWWRSSGFADCPIILVAGGATHEIRLTFGRDVLSGILVDGAAVELSDPHLSGRTISFTSGGARQTVTVLRNGSDIWLDRSGITHVMHEADPIAPSNAVADPSRITAPVSGLVQAVMVAVGDRVEADQTLAVIEAMKMETTLAATASGRVKALATSEGAQAKSGDLLIELELDDNG